MAGGRPPKFTDTVVKKLEEAFSWDCTVEEACLYAGISKVTYYEHIKNKPELVNRFDTLRQTPVLKARETVMKHMSKSYTNAMDYLSRKRKDEFSPRKEVTGADGAPLFNDETRIKANSAIDALIEGDAEQGE